MLAAEIYSLGGYPFELHALFCLVIVKVPEQHLTFSGAIDESTCDGKRVIESFTHSFMHYHHLLDAKKHFLLCVKGTCAKCKTSR